MVIKATGTGEAAVNAGVQEYWHSGNFLFAVIYEGLQGISTSQCHYSINYLAMLSPALVLDSEWGSAYNAMMGAGLNDSFPC